MPDPYHIEIVLELSPQVLVYLRKLHETGLYGFTLEEAAERFVCEWIIRAISDRIITKNRAELAVEVDDG